MAATDDYRDAIAAVAATTALIGGVSFAIAYAQRGKPYPRGQRARVVFWFTLLSSFWFGAIYLLTTAHGYWDEANGWTLAGMVTGIVAGNVVAGGVHPARIGRDEP